MKCTVKVSHRDIGKFREIQRLRKKLDSFKSINNFEIARMEMPYTTIAIEEYISPCSDEKSMKERKEWALKYMAQKLSKYIIEHNLWDLKEEPSNIPECYSCRLQATVKIATNKTGN